MGFKPIEASRVLLQANDSMRIRQQYSFVRLPVIPAMISQRQIGALADVWFWLCLGVYQLGVLKLSMIPRCTCILHN